MLYSREFCKTVGFKLAKTRAIRQATAADSILGHWPSPPALLFLRPKWALCAYRRANRI